MKKINIYFEFILKIKRERKEKAETTRC